MVLAAGTASAPAATLPTFEYYEEDALFATNLEYGRHMLSWQRGVTDRSKYILEAYRDGLLVPGKIYISGHASFSQYFEYTDTAGKFPILGRFPSQHGKGTSEQETTLDTADLGITAAPTPWLSFFVHGIYTDIEFPRQENSQLREWFATIGNPAVTPFYASVGKKTISFGKMESFNPTTHSVTNHFWRVDTDDPVLELGYLDERFHFAFTGMWGGRQLRAATNPDNEDFLGNWALSGQYTATAGDWTFDVGAGYLYSSIYDSDNAHHPGVNSNPQTRRHRNGAIDFWVQAQHGRFTFQAEYTRTERDWPATDAPVEAITVQGTVATEFFKRETHLSAVYGMGIQGNQGDSFEKLEQLILGAETFVSPNFSLAAEYAYNTGFVPLIRIRVASDQNVVTHTAIFSAKFWF